MKRPPASSLACVVCGNRAQNWHHRLNRSRGGLDDDTNLVPLCGTGTTGCHGRVTVNPEWARAHRLTISGYMLRGRYFGPDWEYRLVYNGGWMTA